MPGPRSPRVAAARRLLGAAARRERGRFLVEGSQAVGVGLSAGALHEVYVGESAVPRYADLLRDAAVPVRVVTDAAVAALSETVTPQGIVGVAALPRHRVDELVAPRLVAVLVEARDPGNAGTVVRTADAAGADAVVFAGDCVDPYNGKSVRASAGSLFHLPVIVDVGLGEALAGLRAAGCRLVAATADAGRDLDAALDAGELAGPTAWLFGNEAHGLPAAARAGVDTALRVPVYGRAESLNLAAAAAVCLYASARTSRASGAGRHGRSGPRGGGPE
ncbi:MAG TPA: RNA methyltransferase [Frankiaceae bacterium]|nr:RNA methyltransferase [Frankiaceae bacterium]